MLNTALAHDTAILLLDIYSRSIKTNVYKSTYTQMLIETILFVIAKSLGQVRWSSIDEWINKFGIVQFSSVTQSCLTICNSMDCNMPGLPVHHQLLEFTQTHVDWVGDATQSVIPFSSCLQSFPASGSFSMSQLFTSSGQSIGVLASASVLPMNIQD